MGDRVGAADAAAQAAIAYRRRNLRDSRWRRPRVLSGSLNSAVVQHSALKEAAQPLPLTAREREIVTLVAQGMSNREIADRLTMSVRTVEGHLYRATTKTGACNRNELGAIMRGD